jgi:hypothetical protein
MSRNTYAHKDQSLRGAESANTESAFGQLPSCAKVSTQIEGAGWGLREAQGNFHVDCGNQTLLMSSPGPQADLIFPWCDFAHQNRLLHWWALNSEGLGLVWTGGL